MVTLIRRASLVVALCATAACESSTTEKVVPAGTTMIVMLSEDVTSEEHRPGDIVHATLMAPLYDDASDLLLPAGTRLDAQVVHVDPIGTQKITLLFREIDTDADRSSKIETRPIAFVAASPDVSPPGDATTRTASGVDAGAAEAGTTEETADVVIVPAAESGAVELPRGRRLAVHIVEPARLSVRS